MFIINDETPDEILFPREYGRGLEEAVGYSASRHAEPFPRELLIPRSEWRDRTIELRERKATLADRCKQAGLKHKNQAATNYCWAFSPVWCFEALRVSQGQSLVTFSPASVAGPVTSYRNIGGLGRWAIDYMAEHGVAPTSLWPDTAIDRRYNTPETRSLAQRYRVTEWWNITTFDEAFTCLLRGWPVSAGYNWWRHQISLDAPNWLDGAPAVDFTNSWPNWGDEGRATLQGQRMIPDDAITPRVVTAA